MVNERAKNTSIPSTTRAAVTSTALPHGVDKSSMSIRLALFNDRLIETQWGKDALLTGHGFHGEVKNCPLVKKCTLRIIRQEDPPEAFRKYHAIVHMAAKESGHRLVSLTQTSDWQSKRLKLRKKQLKLLYAGEGSMVPMDLFKRRYKFDAMINYRTSSEIFLGHGCAAINRIASQNKKYDARSVFRRSGGVAVFISNCSGERMKWVKALIDASKAGGVPVDSYGSCYHNVDIPETRNNPNWFEEKINIMRQYKFSIAFENAVRDSYVTEKVFMSLEAGTVPLFFGSDAVKEMVPAGSIVYTNDFRGGPKHLTNYLKTLTSNFSLFAQHFEWSIDGYRNMKIVKQCKWSWQCSACGWVANQLLAKKQLRRGGQAKK
jgi:hypothetical protein